MFFWYYNRLSKSALLFFRNMQIINVLGINSPMSTYPVKAPLSYRYSDAQRKFSYTYIYAQN